MGKRNIELAMIHLSAVWATALLAACASSGPPDAASEFRPVATRSAPLNGADYDPANWTTSPNFYAADRKPPKVSVIVIHTTQGSYSGTISWFQNPASQVSAHYTISKGGDVMQMVYEHDIAWHVGSENSYTIGIEHEGYIDDPAWVTDPMLQASAKLTCYLLKKWGLPPDKDHVKGHVELPNQTHKDPGPYWPWDKYMGMVKACYDGPVQPSCNGPCDDGNACTDDSCVNGVCAHNPTTGAICWDGDACTAGESCQAGVCTGGKVVKNCDDGNPCTDDGCKNGACTYANNTAPCDLGTGCAGAGICDAGSCKSLSNAGSCDDGNPCTDDSCQGKTCVHAANTGNCEDGDSCTEIDKCVAGQCVSGPRIVCDDGDGCTVGDYCAQGICLSGAPRNCSDGFDCTVDLCQEGECVHTGGVQAGGASCKGSDLLVISPCGGAPVVQPCPPNQPCVQGVCGGPGPDGGTTDVAADGDGSGAADSANLDVKAIDSDGTIRRDADSAGGVAGSGAAAGHTTGCQASGSGHSVLGWMLVLVGVALGISRRYARRSRRQG